MRPNKKGILTFFLILAFSASFLSLPLHESLVHNGGKAVLAQMFFALFKPNLSSELLGVAIAAAGRTLAYAAAGMSLAILVGFILGIFASGEFARTERNSQFQKWFFRGLLGAMRTIHELVWAWLFVASIGLSPLAAILAIAIPYGGILGKIYADMLTDVAKGPVVSLKTAGAGRLQLLFYGYLPQAINNMLSYTMYRFECAIRSASIMSFVGLGGLGYQIQRYLDDLDYASVWTLLGVLIGLVVAIDLWSNLIRNKGSRSQAKGSLLAFAGLIIGSWVFIQWVDQIDWHALFSEKNQMHSAKFLKGLLGGDEGLKAFINPNQWLELFSLSLDTLTMSIMAIGLASIAALISVIPAAKNIANGTLLLKKGKFSWVFYYLIRGLFVVTRAIPELIWAMVIIFIFKPGILPGAIALAIHNYGIIGKLCAEVIEEIDVKSIQNLSASGANATQLLFYGILPMTIPKFLTYMLYRWEVIMRTTIVVGFVGAGGLGQSFKMAMSFFQYAKITQILVCYFVLVIFSEMISQWMRKFVTEGK